jgi:alanine racemase
MDYLMLDVTDLKGVIEGDEVIIFGNFVGHTAADLGAALGTIPHEILTGLSPRVERVLVD